MDFKKLTKILLALLSAVLIVVGLFSAFAPKKVAAKQKDETVRIGKMVNHPSIQLDKLIEYYLEECNVNKDKIAILIHSFETGEEYILNPNVDFTAASTYKLPLGVKYYEMINDGEISLSDHLTVQSNHYEEGGPTYYAKVGSAISVETLLHRMIQISDNTASHVLFENLGGWVEYKKKIAKYSNHDLNDSFFVKGNVQTVQYLSDCLDYVYHHKDSFKTLIKDMKSANPTSYLNKYTGNVTAQKYGYYNSARNSAGIVLDGHPYSIVVLTSLYDQGEVHMGKINKICHDYFNTEKKWDIDKGIVDRIK